MHLITRRDGPLVTALILASLVVFQDSVRSILTFARQVEIGYRLELLPGLVILLVMFGYHQAAKHQEAKRMAAEASSESRLLLDRTRELEQLSQCAQGLAQALSIESLRVAVLRYLPDLLGNADAWLLGSNDGRWEVLADTRFNTEAWWDNQLTGIVKAVERQPETPAPFRFEAWWCYPLLAHDAMVGVLGVHVRSEQPPARVERLIEALGALLAIAIRNVQLFAQIRAESTRDPLTGCLRRTPALEQLRAELARSRRTGNPVSAIMFDLDGFKQLNDTHGHACGDAALASIGRLLCQLLRNSDAKCRFGGDEFLLVLPETPSGGAYQVATKICHAIAEMPIPWGKHILGITASLGVVTCGAGEVPAEGMIAQADEALYAAKREGRNCVRVGASSEASLCPIQLDQRAGGARVEDSSTLLDCLQAASTH